MLNVTLTRIVLDEMDRSDYAVAVCFEDLDGKKVSLAFDGRYSREDWGLNSKELGYGVYNDCPVIDGDGRKLKDAAVVRNLRDALNKLNLGD